MQVTTPLVSLGGFDSIETSADPKAFVTWMSLQRQFGPDSGIAALKLSPTDRVLDLGCGPGADSKTLREHTEHVVGLDLSQSMVTKAISETPTASFVGRRWTGPPLLRQHLRCGLDAASPDSHPKPGSHYERDSPNPETGRADCTY